MAETARNPGILRKIEARLGVVIKVIVAVLLAGMIILVFMNVIFRYFLNSSIAWSEEISRFMMIWVTFLGAVIAYIENEHLGLDLLVKVLPKKVSRAMVILADLLVLAATYFLASGGYTVALRTLESGWTSPATGTPYGIVYLVVPITGAILFFQCLIKLIENLRALAPKPEGRA